MAHSEGTDEVPLRDQSSDDRQKKTSIWSKHTHTAADNDARSSHLCQ